MKNTAYAYNPVDEIGDIKGLLENAALKYAQREAFVYRTDEGIRQVGYAAFKADTDALGTAFHSLGLKNERIAVLGENAYEWILAYFAAVNGSSTVVPLDKEQAADAIGGMLRECGAKAIVYAASYADVAEEAAKAAPCLQYRIVWGSDGNDAPGVLCFEGLLEKGAERVLQGDDAYQRNEIDRHATTVIIYTSGTTGKSKGVMLSHANLAADTVGGLQHVRFGPRSLLVLPLHHTFSFTGGVLIMLHAGSTIFINSSLKNLAADMALHKPTDILLVPLFVESLYKKIWEAARKKGKDGLLKNMTGLSNAILKMGIDARSKLFHSVLENFGGCLETVITGGALMDPKYVGGFRVLGVNVLNGYGITECSPVVSVNRNRHYRDGSVGRPLPCCRVRIDRPDENGEGEIQIRGAIVMKGYYNDPQATRDAFDGEWFKTGDIGRIDADGFLYVTGRIKNVIVLSNGKNVYPEELEMRLLNLPYVKEALVRAVPAEAAEPVITAEVFPDADYLAAHAGMDVGAALSADVDAINRSLPAYKRIGAVKTRATEFEKTASKKIKRYVTGV